MVKKGEFMKYGIPDKKQDEIHFQPEFCLSCRRIIGLDCGFGITNTECHSNFRSIKHNETFNKHIKRELLK
jgi:hypothetical protein